MKFRSEKWIDRLIVAGIVLFGISLAAAAIPSRYYTSGLFTNWTKTDTSLSVNVDTSGGMRQYVIRLADSAAANRSGAVVQQSEIHILYFANFSNNANDSTNFGLPGVNYHMYPLPYNMYADRYILNSNAPSATGPTTFRDDLPSVSTDSSFILRISRNASFAAGQKCGITLYKVAKGQGLSYANTGGVFYDMVRFDEAVLGTAGTSRQVFVNLVIKKLR